MSDQEQQHSGEKNPSDEMWDELKQRARKLIDTLEEGDFNTASTLIEQLNDCRDRTIYIEVGKLTRGLHEALVNFEIDAGTLAAGQTDEETESRMANAQDRLDYVINLTQRAANTTMDMVEEGVPLSTELGEVATALKVDWEQLKHRQLTPEQYRELYQRIDQHLEKTTHGSQLLGEKFNTILLAQDFQDLTGQVIRKVITLVQEVEDRMVELMRVAGQVEELTGIVRSIDPKQPEDTLDAAPEGPQIHAEKRADVVSGQDEVDDLLSSLGF